MTGPGLRFVVDEWCAFWNGPKLIAKMSVLFFKAGCHAYSQKLLPHEEKKNRNAFQEMPQRVSSPLRRTTMLVPSCNSVQTFSISKIRTRAHRGVRAMYALSVCHHLDSVLHMLSGNSDQIISSMKSECCNMASRMIPIVNKGPWGPGLVTTDVGSGDQVGIAILGFSNPSNRYFEGDGGQLGGLLTGERGGQT